MKKNNRKHLYMLSASLICANLMQLQEDIITLEESGVDSLHVDIMDGIFVPRYGLFPEIITQLRTFSSLPIVLHMMVDDAEKYIQTFVKAGVSNPHDMLVVHAEATNHLDRVLSKIKSYGIKAGVAINPATSLVVLDYLLDSLDHVMVMAINPGIVGHPFIPSSFQKITDLHSNFLRHKDISISVDGGVTFKTAPELIRAGADVLVCGSKTFFLPGKSLKDNILNFKEHLDRNLS